MHGKAWDVQKDMRMERERERKRKEEKHTCGINERE